MLWDEQREMIRNGRPFGSLIQAPTRSNPRTQPTDPDAWAPTSWSHIVTATIAGCVVGRGLIVAPQQAFQRTKPLSYAIRPAVRQVLPSGIEYITVVHLVSAIVRAMRWLPETLGA